jgi:poly(3-hydroxyalkanoate) synthetase
LADQGQIKASEQNISTFGALLSIYMQLYFFRVEGNSFNESFIACFRAIQQKKRRKKARKRNV